MGRSAKSRTLSRLGVAPNAPSRVRPSSRTSVRVPEDLPRPLSAWRAKLPSVRPATSLRLSAGARAELPALDLRIDARTDARAFEGLKGLVRLRLRVVDEGAPLAAIVERLAHGSRLLELAIDHASEIPDAIAGLKTLRALAWRGAWALRRGPEQLPEALFALERLEELDLSGGRLREVPRGIRGLVALRRLDLRGNAPLARLAPELGTLRRLVEIDLRAPHALTLRAIVDVVRRLPAIERVFVSSREPRPVVPDTIAQLRAEHLVIAAGLGAVPDALARMKRLRVLSLEHNRLVRLPSALVRAPRLEELRLFDNPSLDLAHVVALALGCRRLRGLWLPPVALASADEDALVAAGLRVVPSVYGTRWWRTDA